MGRRMLGSILAGVSLATLVACGTANSAKPGTFHPAGASSSASDPAPTSAPPRADGLTWPPFGPGVHIVMTSWLPNNASQRQAVITAKDFLLAFLYAEYKGNKDTRWTKYVSGSVIEGLKSTLDVPAVTTESFKGTIRFTHMQAFPDPSTKGAIDVSECFDNSHSQNTSLATGKVIPDHTPRNQHYYQNTDVLARHGGWHVVSVYPVVYYPRAKECRP